MMDNNTVEIWKTYVTVWDAEANRFWIRSNIFLLVNGALLTVVTGLSKIPLISFTICVFGTVLAYLWLQTNKIGKHYIDRWKTLIWECEKELPDKLSFSKRIDTLKGASKYHSLRSSTYYMSIVIKMLIIIWVVLALYFGGHLYKSKKIFNSTTSNNEISIILDGTTYTVQKKK